MDFIVWGEPQPFPKKRTNRGGMIFCHDPKGEKRGWMMHIKKTVEEEMDKNNWQTLNDKTALSMRLVFYRTKPKSAKKMEYPHKKPDVDNFAYAVTNAINGVAYYDDSRIIHLEISKFWIDEIWDSPCVKIYIQPITGETLFKKG